MTTLSTQRFKSDLAMLEERYRKHLASLKRKDGTSYSEKYVWDKLSRLRRIATVITPKELNSISERNFLCVMDGVIKSFAHTESYGIRNKHLDLVVVIRQLYEMNNKNKLAPRHTHYGGIKRY